MSITLDSSLGETGRLSDSGISDTYLLQESDSDSNTNCLQQSDYDGKPPRLQECDRCIDSHELKESHSDTWRLQESDSDAHKLQKVNSATGDEDCSAGIHFFPALYIQRYTFALSYLKKYNIRSVIDFGCSECGFMKVLPTVSSLERVALVDIDRDLLAKRKSAINPELRHYICRRCKPLHVALLAGSAEETDSRLLDYEAVTLIEVIEHLHPKVLENVTHNVFGNLSPKLCVVTTPNAEFNILFENDDPKQFRHWDHKFEWTRQEFCQWCDRICQVYGYCVEYSGVGYCPSRPNTDHLGPCSQAAIFTRQEGNISSPCTQAGSLCYELIAEADFPFEENVMSVEDKVDLEVSYVLRQMFARRRDDLMFDESVMIPVSSLAKMDTIRALCDESGLRESLERTRHRLSSDGLLVVLDDNDDDSYNDLLDDEGEGDDGRDGLESTYDMKLWIMKDPGGENYGSLCDIGSIVSEEDWDTEPG